MKRLPHSIDEPNQILFWSTDEFLPAATLFGIGIFAKMLTIMLIATFLFLRFYRRFRDGKPNGYILHMVWWIGLLSINSKTVGNPFARRFSA